jgi:hypothetical protein
MPYRRFLGYSALASLVWGVVTVALGCFAAVTALALVVVKISARRHRRRPVKSAIVASGGPPRTSARRTLREFTHSQEK